MIALSQSFAAWLPYLSFLLLLLAALVVLGVILFLRRAARRPGEQSTPPTGEAAAKAAAAEAPPASSTPREAVVLRDAGAVLKETLKRLRSAVPGGDHRYATPWFLMVGTGGSGKTAVLKSLPLRQPMDPVEGEGGLSAWFFEQGVVLDADGALLGEGGGKGAANSEAKGDSGEAWMRLLRLLQRVRPRRPLDGLILTLSVEDLLDEAPRGEEERLAFAEILNRRLWDLQRTLGLALPVYVILTQADRVLGFEGFWQEMPQRRLQEIFGWSSPYAPQTAFQASWVDEAFSAMEVDLLRATLEVSAERENPEDSDGLILFQSNFARLRRPLAETLGRVFRPNAYHEPLMVRGIYASGHLDASLTAGERHRAGQAPAEVKARPVLLGELFEDRIFAETGLVRANRRSLFSRNRKVLAAQVALAATVLVLTLGLTLESLRIGSDIRRLDPVLRQIATDMADIRQKEAQFARLGQQERSRVSFLTIDNTRRLLDAMTQISTNSLRSVFLPASWVSGLDYRISEFITGGLENVVLRAMHNQFDQRMKQVLQDARLGRDSPADAGRGGALQEMTEFTQLRTFVTELREIERQARSYNQLSESRDLAEVANLVDYLFDIPLPQQFFAYPEFVQSALQRVHIRRFEPEDYRDLAVSRARNLTWRLYGRLFNSGPSLSVLVDLARELRQLEDGGLGPDRDAAAFQRVIQLVESAEIVIAAPDQQWIYSVSFNPDEPLDQVLSDMAQSDILGPELAAELTRFGESEATVFIEKLQAIRSRSLGTLLEADHDGYLHLSEPLTQLRSRLAGLFAEDFMTVRPRADLALRGEEAGRLVWNSDRLQRALRLYSDYEAFLASDLQALPEIFRDRLERLAAARLDLGLRAAIAEAISFGPRDRLERLAGWEEGLVQRVGAFSRVSGDLDRLLAIFRQLDLEASYYDLQDLLALQIGQLLARADRLLDSDGLYRPFRGLTDWDGKGDPVLFAFDLRGDGELEFYLDGQRARVEELLRQTAEPLLAFALNDDLDQASLPMGALSRWQRILQAVSAHNARRPGNPLERLERSLRFDLRQVRADTCDADLAAVPGVGGSGFFEDRLISFVDDLSYRCETLRDNDLQQTFARVAGSFNETLAGRYPFAAVESAQEATPADIRSFFRRVESDIAFLTEEDRRLDALGAEARSFLIRLAETRRFFAPLLEEEATASPFALSYSIAFRVNRGQELGGNQIIDWRFADDERVITNRSSERQGRWRYGDPAAVTLRWAKDAPTWPIAARGGAVEQAAARLRFEGEGGWAFLRLLDRFAASPGDFEERRDPDPETLRFEIETADRQLGESASLPAETARVFLRFKLSVQDPATGDQLATRLPDFPTRAPSPARLAQN